MKETGPIVAPSGPDSQGDPAGIRAHVYSYILNPNRDELFVGFLEKPEPYGVSKPSTDIRDFERWAEGKLIKRVDDPEWVPVTSPEGQSILDAVSQPNRRGQTALYQKVRPE